MDLLNGWCFLDRRGIGLGLVKKFLARDNTVIATSRKSSDATHLLQLRTEYPERLHVMDLDTSAKSSIMAWAEGIKTSGVNHVDVSAFQRCVYYALLAWDDCARVTKNLNASFAKN